MKKGFTLIELVVSVALLVIILTFAGLIFKVSIGSYRLAGANAEIMRNFRAITSQLNADFAGFQKDGFLTIATRHITDGSKEIRSDRIAYYCTGDFQSWFAPNGNDFPKSNIAQVSWGHDTDKSQLFREVNMLTPVSLNQEPTILLPTLTGLPDCNDTSFAEVKTKFNLFKDFSSVFFGEPKLINTDHSNSIRNLLCQNINELKIQWANGAIQLEPPVTGLRKIVWVDTEIASGGDDKINMSYSTMPRAIKFTFRLYDSRGIIENGRLLSHIVYIDPLEGK